MRRPDWDTRLARWATRRNGEPFRWGQTDCAMLCFEAFDAMTGQALAAAHRGKYDSAAGAIRYQIENSVNVGIVLARAGCVEVVPGFQQRGDFIVVDREPFPHGHVCFGAKALSASIGGAVSWGRLNFGVPEGMRILRVL